LSLLLDTCVLSELTRPTPHGGVSAWLSEQDAASLYLSVLTVGEIEKGVAALPRGKKSRSLTTWLATAVGVLDRASDRLRGGRDLGTHRNGLGACVPPNVVDGLIAATALHHGLTVVTQRRGLPFGRVTLLNPEAVRRSYPSSPSRRA
jgi:predicted nucleic acid-binding protein